jgi:hypothetical protein
MEMGTAGLRSLPASIHGWENEASTTREFMKLSTREAWTLVGFVFLSMTLATAHASDGVFDENDEYPAVGVVAAVVTISGELDYAGAFCSGTLIRPDTYLTAGHCLFFDTRQEAAISGYLAEYWVSFDSVVEDNDFYCFLKDIGHPNAGDVRCNSTSVNGVTFHGASVRVVHPDYARITQQGNGTLNIQELFTKHYIDLAVLLLETPIDNITPLETAPWGAFDDKNGLRGTPLVDVGYGLNFHKSIPAEPAQPGGDGPMTFQGDFGIRRIAEIGTLRGISSQTMLPTQQSALGEDSVCYGDSGSPLFLKRADGTVDPTVSGVLTGWTQWCMGAFDPFARVDTLEAVSFLACVEAAGTTQQACECGIEDRLGLCGN